MEGVSFLAHLVAMRFDLLGFLIVNMRHFVSSPSDRMNDLVQLCMNGLRVAVSAR